MGVCVGVLTFRDAGVMAIGSPCHRAGDKLAPPDLMDDSAVLDTMLELAADPRLIPGIYNYCDRCCWRCGFTDRCLSYQHSAQLDTAHSKATPAEIAEPVTRTLRMLRAIATRVGVEPASSRQDDEAMRAYQRRVDAAFNDPLVVRAREYSQTVSHITRVLLPAVDARGDAVATAAVVRVQETCGTIASKIYRAVSDRADDDFDPGELQSDANGSAKVARLLIDESRRSWRVLMEVGRATANGVPARLVGLLDEIDAALSRSFPRALEFKRPGFDTEVVAPQAAVSGGPPDPGGSGRGQPPGR